MTGTGIDERKFTTVAETAIEIGRERRKKMKKMKAALLKNDEAEALELARDIVGINKEQDKSAA